MSKHTPELWYTTGGMIASEDDPSGKTIAHVGTPADAAHIVACVNACEGIKPAAVKDVLAALCGLLREYDQHIPDDCECPRVRQAADAARAALAKAKGE